MFGASGGGEQLRISGSQGRPKASPKYPPARGFGTSEQLLTDGSSEYLIVWLTGHQPDHYLMS